MYGEPIVVDKTWVNNPKRFPTHEDAVKELTRQISDSMLARTINCPDWETTQVALTAARIHRPLGTKISLGDYVLHLRGWVEVLQPPSEGVDEAGNAIISYDKMDADVKYLRDKLIEYQTLLNSKKIKDERVRKIEFQGPMPRWVIFTRMVQTGLLALFLFCCAAPGLIIWAPSWFLIRRAERNLLAKGPRWERFRSGNENAVWFPVHPRFVGNIRYFCHLESVIVACGLVAHHSFLRRWRGSRAFLLLVVQSCCFCTKRLWKKCEVCGRSASVW